MLTHINKDVQTQTGMHVYISSSGLERPPPKPIPRAFVLNEKQLWPTLSESKYPLGNESYVVCLGLKNKCYQVKFLCFSIFFQLQQNLRQQVLIQCQSDSVILHWLLHSSSTHSE